MLVYVLYSNSYSLVFKDKVPRGDGSGWWS